jgi:hypothetical protein
MLPAFGCNLGHLGGRIRQPAEGALACRARFWAESCAAI